MAKEIKTALTELAALKRGVDQVADAVRVTLGSKGRNAVLEQRYRTPQVTNDGVTIAKDIDLADGYENMGAQLIKEVASKTNDAVGDGTTTAIVLAQAMVAEGAKNRAAGANPMRLRKGIERAVAACVAAIDDLAQPVDGSEAIRQVVRVSAEDDEIGDLISAALEKVNDSNGIVVESAPTAHSSLEERQGFSFERGYISAQMINEPATAQCVYEDVDILLYDKKFTTMNDIYAILERVLARKKPLLLICDGLEDEALQIVNLNNQRGIFSVVAVQGPTHGDNRERELQDMEALVGGVALAGSIKDTITEITDDLFGHADRVVVEKDKTTIVGGTADADKIQRRIATIRAEMAEYSSEFTTQVCQQRLSRLAGNTVVLKVGASTETEYNEKKLRIEDALHSAEAAIASGIVPGGGTTYLRLIPILDALTDAEPDIATGIRLVARALRQPLAQIAANAGKDPAVIVETVLQFPAGQGYNVLTDTCEDLLAAGIIEPANVAKSALQNAASMAMMTLTVGAMVGDAPKKDDDKEEE